MSICIESLGEATIDESEQGEYLFINLPRHSNGKLMSFSEWGMYPLFYFDKQCSVLCPECANKSEEINAGFPDFLPKHVDVNYEDEELYCDDCSRKIESAYKECAK